MISPLKGCSLSDRDGIGMSAARQIAVEDAGIPADLVSDMQSDYIKLEGRGCYKVQFTGTVTDYRYIIDAETGTIIARAFHHIDGE